MLKSFRVYQGILDQHPTSPENVDSLIQQKSSALPQLPLAGVEPPSIQQKGPAQPAKSSINYEVTLSSPSGEAQHAVLPKRNIILITPNTVR